MLKQLIIKKETAKETEDIHNLELITSEEPVHQDFEVTKGILFLFLFVFRF